MDLLKLKKWQKIVSGILIFIVLVLFAIPRVAKLYIVKNSQELVGRELTIEKIRLNYFSGVLRIKGFTLYESNKQTPFVSFEKLLINLDYWPFLRNELHLSKIELNTLFCQVEQNGNWFNFSDMLPESDTLNTEKEPEEVQDSSSMLITLNNISISKSQLQYTDQQLEHTIDLNDINFHIPGFSFNSGSTQLALDFEFTDGGGFHTNLDFNQLDSTYAIQLQIDSLNLDIVEPYIKSSMTFQELNGYFSNNIYLQGNLQHLLKVQLNGWNKVDGLKMIDLQNRKILSFNHLLIDIDSCDLDKQDIHFSEITLDSLYFFLELNDSINNWLEMMTQLDSVEIDTLKTANANETDSSDFNFSVKKLSMQHGEIAFQDIALKDKFEASIHNIFISSKDIYQRATDIDIKLTATLNESAEIKTTANLNLVNSEDISLDLTLQKFAMKDLEPYFVHYLGYPVESGFMNFSTANDLTSATMISNNKLYIRNFKLGHADKSEAEIKIPLKLAIGILSNKDGIIELDIPIESQGEETSIKNIGKLIAKTFGNLIVKVATHPADFLASAFGTNPEKLKEIKIGLFENMPNKENLETLDLISKILSEKPQLSVQLDYVVDKEHFKDSLALQLAIEKYMQQNKQQQLPADSTLFSFISKKLNNSDITKDKLPELCREFATPELLNQRLDSTRIRQIDFVHDYLQSNKQTDVERLIITNAASDTIPAGSGYAHFIISFQVNGEKNTK